MTTDQLLNILVTVTCIEMMVAVRLEVSLSELTRVGREWRLVARALLANYVGVPVVAVGLLLLLHAHPMVAAGFLILASCPGRHSGRRSPRSPGETSSSPPRADRGVKP